MVNYEKLQKSLKRLQERYEEYQNLDESIPEYMKESVSESVIQRFEICFETLWKTLRRYLVDGLGFGDVPSSPKPVFRMANENDLLEPTVEQWFEYAKARNDTSHDYDGNKLNACLALIPYFIDDAIILYCAMSGEEWN